MTPEQLKKVIDKRVKDKRKLRRRPQRQAAPIAIEKELEKELLKILNIQLSIIRKNIIKDLPMLVEENKVKKPQNDSKEFRTDINVARRLAKLFRASRVQLKKRVPVKRLKKLLEKFSRQINGFNKKQVGGAFKSVIGLSLLEKEPFLAQDLEEFVIGNTNLIQNVTNEFIDETQQIVFSGLRRGERHEEIAKKILGRLEEGGKVSRLSKAKSRAALIARDQVNKLNGQLTQLRQTNAGVTKYKWRTVKDSRVRPEHSKREGEVFSWDIPPPDGHPGEPINCRCFAEPVLDDLI